MSMKQRAKEIIEDAMFEGSALIGWTWEDELEETCKLEKAVRKYAKENGVKIEIVTSFVGECRVNIEK